jgi:hypothetical protein
MYNTDDLITSITCLGIEVKNLLSQKNIKESDLKDLLYQFADTLETSRKIENITTVTQNLCKEYSEKFYELALDKK